MAPLRVPNCACSITSLLLAQSFKELSAHLSPTPPVLPPPWDLCLENVALLPQATRLLRAWTSGFLAGSRDPPGVLGLASCGLASASLPCGSYFPPSPLDLLELEAFHGLSLPQAKPQIVRKAGEVCLNRPWPTVGEPALRGGPGDGQFILWALLGLMGEDQELSLTSWTLSLRRDQPTSMPWACSCRLGGCVCHNGHSILTYALPGSFQACSSCTGGLCLHQEPQEARPCHSQGRDVVFSWLKNVPCSIPGSLAARRATSAFLMPGFGPTSARVTVRERGLFLSFQRAILK